MTISKHLLIKFNEENLPENFVSLAVQIKEKQATHAAILIRHLGRNYLHHFPGNTKPEVIDDFNEDGWYIYKIIPSIEQEKNEVGAFLQYCRRICNNSNITYGYIADGSSYSNRGEFISRIGLPEFGTCVGFCANTLTNGLIDVEECYFELEDWDDSELTDWVDKWSIKQATKKYPNLDWSSYNAFKKRITPIEYLASGFIYKYPVKKIQIESIKNQIQEVIDDKF